MKETYSFTAYEMTLGNVYKNRYILVLAGYSKHDYASAWKNGQDDNMFET